MSVRITATGAVAFALLSWLTVPVSACDERYFKKCEGAATAAAAAEDNAVAVKRRAAGRVQVVMSRRVRHIHFARRVHAPGLTADRDVKLASAESRLTNAAPETALARRFRGFINPMPMAQNGFEPFRKPHLVPLNLEPPVVAAVADADAQAVAEAPSAPEPQAETPKPAVMALASAESRPVTLGEPAAPAAPAAAMVAQAERAAPVVAQAFVTEAPPVKDPTPGRFPVHQLVIALCGALGAASALRFIVGV